MQQKWDDLDKSIAESFDKTAVDEGYTERLLRKVHRTRANGNQSYVSAFSLIMAGFLALFLYTSNLQYKIVEIRTIARSHILFIEQNYSKNDILRYFIGE